MNTISKFDIITESLEILGVLGEGEEPNNDQVESCNRTLTSIIKAWQTEGINIWAVDNLEIPIEEGKQSYTIGPDLDVDVPYRPIRIVNAVFRGQSGTDIPVNLWSREEYWRLSEKSTRGKVLNVYLDRRKTNGVLYVWPTGSGAEDEKLILQIQRGLSATGDPEADVDVPAEYFLALSYWLATALGPKYGASANQMSLIVRQARTYKEDAEGYNREDTSLFIEPDPHWTRGQ